MSKSEKDTKAYLNIQEVKKLRKFVKKEMDRAHKQGNTQALVNKTLIELILFSGLRAREICNLNLRDLNRKKQSIVVRSGKGQLQHSVIVVEELLVELDDFIKRCRPGTKLSGPLFVDGKGIRLSEQALYRRVKRIGRQSGLPHISPQVLRRTFAVHLYSVEHDLECVHKQLGNENVKTTIRYLFEPQLRFLQQQLGHKHLKSTISFLSD